LDGNPINNHVSNLAWGAAEKNYDDRRRHGTDVAGSSHGRAKLTEKEVLKIWKRLRSGAKHKVIAEEFGVSRSTVPALAAAADGPMSRAVPERSPR
jgi:FixJ family two-component response regulator